jgi:reactive chlorine resistance protein C
MHKFATACLGVLLAEVADRLGFVIMALGILIALYPLRPELSALGSFLLIFMAMTTLSFLITTPEAWVPALGDANHGFPYLSGVGRLIVKDAIMLGAAVLTMADAARESLRRRRLPLRSPPRSMEQKYCGAG